MFPNNRLRSDLDSGKCFLASLFSATFQESELLSSQPLYFHQQWADFALLEKPHTVLIGNHDFLADLPSFHRGECCVCCCLCSFAFYFANWPCLCSCRVLVLRFPWFCVIVVLWFRVEYTKNTKQTAAAGAKTSRNRIIVKNVKHCKPQKENAKPRRPAETTKV